MESEAQIRQFLDQEDAWLRDTVRAHGWAVQGVLGYDEEPPFSYTVGLWGFDHPELVIFGMPHGTAHRALNELGERVRAGGRIAEGELLTFGGWPHRLHVLPLVDPAEVLYAANRFYRRPDSDPVPGLQLVWDDRWGHFPWEPEYDPPQWLQPLPGTFRA